MAANIQIFTHSACFIVQSMKEIDPIISRVSTWNFEPELTLIYIDRLVVGTHRQNLLPSALFVYRITAVWKGYNSLVSECNFSQNTHHMNATTDKAWKERITTQRLMFDHIISAHPFIIKTKHTSYYLLSIQTLDFNSSYSHIRTQNYSHINIFHGPYHYLSLHSSPQIKPYYNTPSAI